jgi:hypothetical protein
LLKAAAVSVIADKNPTSNNQPSFSHNNKVFTMATVQQARAPEKKKERPSALRSIIAGSTAGAVEIRKFSHHLKT